VPFDCKFLLKSQKPQNTVHVRRSNSTYEGRCFAAARPKLWNSLPADLQRSDVSFQRFKRLLKTFLFRCSDRGTLWETVKAAPLKFSHLHTYVISC